VRVLAEAEAGAGLAADLADAAAAGAGLEGRDRASLTRLVLEATRRRATLDAVGEAYSGRRTADLEPAARQALRVGVFELLHSRSAPPWAAVHEAVEAAKAVGGRRAAGFCNAVLRKVAAGLRRLDGPAPRPSRSVLPLEEGGHAAFDREVFPPPSRRAEHWAAVRSHPAWIVERWISLFGERGTERILGEDNRPPELTVRLRGGAEEVGALRARLEAEGRVRRAGRAGDVLALAPGARPDALPGFAEGRLVVQDETSTGPARALAPRPGDRVLDLCAAPGGKAVQLADALGGRGLVAAVDRERSRLSLLRDTVRRTGAAGVFPVLADGARPPFRAGAFDRVLVDAPCSNSGVFRRRAEARWRFSTAGLADLAALQARLLRSAAALVRPGGRLVYATCSLEPAENGDVVEAFVAGAPGFRVAAEERVLPGAADGGGWAVLERER
jgi:16S rRNA (cytosine967-C5)-methyltransferase